MEKLWQVFRVRKDIELSFVMAVLGAVLFLTFFFIGGTAMFTDYLVLTLLAGWLIFTVYFFVAFRGYNKHKKSSH